MQKFDKVYLLLIFVFALAVGAILSDLGDSRFEIVKNSSVFAPIDEFSGELGEKVEGAYVSDAKVNINEADIYELQRISGIGEVTAEKIIDYRIKNGKFRVIEDIMKVDGIGRKTFDEIKPYITIE